MCYIKLTFCVKETPLATISVSLPFKITPKYFLFVEMCYILFQLRDHIVETKVITFSELSTYRDPIAFTFTFYWLLSLNTGRFRGYMIHCCIFRIRF